MEQSRLAERGGTVYLQKLPRCREIPQDQQPSGEDETRQLSQQDLGSALEIISDIARQWGSRGWMSRFFHSTEARQAFRVADGRNVFKTWG